MPAYKSTEDYEFEAKWVGKCLIHPVKQIARKLWLRRHGDLGVGLEVCHTCDHPNCILDEHHFIGTHAENLHDASVKHRFKKHSTKKMRRLRSEAAKAQWADEVQRKALLDGQSKPEVKAVMSAKARCTWSDPEMRALRSIQSTELWKSKKYAKNVSDGLKRAAAAKSIEERSAIAKRSWAARKLS